MYSRKIKSPRKVFLKPTIVSLFLSESENVPPVKAVKSKKFAANFCKKHVFFKFAPKRWSKYTTTIETIQSEIFLNYALQFYKQIPIMCCSITNVP